MMDRNREARRGAMAAVNGGLSRKRQQRTPNLRDSPEEDGATEMQQEPSRLRDRGIKKDRDRDRERSSRSKRRRGERSMHGNREEGDDSSEESIDDDDDEEEEDASVTVRLPASAPNSAQIPSSSSSIQLQNHHHVVKRNSFSANNNGKPVRPPAPSWKVAEEMIGVSIPRKARSSSLKRSQDCGDVIHRQASTSPARPSPSSATAVSPSSSNASVRKKKVSSGTKQHRPPKIAKSSSVASSIQEIEIEVAEVLYGMTRQTLPLVNKQENCKVDSKDTEVKSSVCSPNSISQQQLSFPSSSSPMVATAPKRKRPRLKFDEERPASPSTKTESEIPAKTEEVSSPKSEKNTLAFPAVENGVGSCDPGDAQQDSAKPGSCNQVLDSKVADSGEEGMKNEDVAILSSKPMEASCADTNINCEEPPAAAKVENLREEKFSIDLMAPPLPEKSSSDKDGLSDFVSDHKSLDPEKKMLPTLDIAIGETEKAEKVSKQERTSEHTGNFLAQDFDLKKQTLKEKIPDMQLDLGKHDKDGLSLCGGSKQQQQVPKQQQKSARIDPKQEKSAPLTSMPLPVPIAGWPGGFPSFGYMGQVPSLQAVVPMDGSLVAAKTVQQPQPPHFLQPHMRPKRCATHCYIAQNIHYHQQIARMHPFWPAAAAAAAVNVAKQYNLNAVPPSDSAAILGNPLPGGFPPPRSSGPLQDKSASSVAMVCTVSPPKEKSSATPASASNSNTFMEGAQRKQFLLPQSSQPGSSVAAPPNMIHGPAFLFPINQQPAVANRSGAPSKPTPPTGNAAPSAADSASSAAAGSGASGHSANTMSFNYAGLEAQYMTILQNNAILPNPPYPFPLAAGHVGGPPPFRGTVPAQGMPFFNGPFYSSQMVPSQQQQQQLMQQHQQQQNHQNPSTSSGSSSSQKHNTQQSQQQQQQQQQQRVQGGSNSHSFPTSKQPLHLLPHQARQLESEATCEDSPSTADSSRALQAQKGIYGQNFAMPMHSQNFALISPMSTAGGSHSENKQPPVVAHQHQAMKVDLTPSQAYAMSFASFGGSAAAAAAAAAASTPGLDFSAIVQNPAMLQNLPEVARHGYHPAVAMAAAAAQHKKSLHEDGKSVGETTAANANASTAEDGKTDSVTAATKSVAQHSLSFSRPDNDSAASNIMSNHADSSSRALNLLHPPANGAQALNPTSASTAITNSSSSLPLPLSQSKQQQYYQQMLHFQHQQQHSQQQQQQRMLYMQHQQHQQPPPQQQQQQQSMQLHHQQMLLQQQQQMVSRQQMTRTGKPSSVHNTSSSSNISSTTMAARFPQGGLAGFPPSLIQGGSSGASQSPQWKTSSTNRAATPAPASSATSSSSSAKNQIPQQQQPQKQQQQQQQQPLLNPNAHHTQISFGVSASSNKPSISSPAAASAINTGSPQNSVSKISATAGGGGNGGSPRASSTSKAVQPPASVLPTLPLQQQHATAKNSPSAAVSSLKPSSPITNNSSSSNRNMTTSILGHPHITPANSSSGKKLQSHQHQSQKQQPFQQPQLFFNNPYIQAQTSQRRQTEQPNSTTTTTATSGMISLSPASLTLAGGASVTSDPAKAAAAAAAASNIKGLMTQQQQQAGILQHSAQFAPATSMAPNPFMSAAFNYVQVMSPSSVSVKPASAAATPEQKQSTATGNENVRAWKPEKR